MGKVVWTSNMGSGCMHADGGRMPVALLNRHGAMVTSRGGEQAKEHNDERHIFTRAQCRAYLIRLLERDCALI